MAPKKAAPADEKPVVPEWDGPNILIEITVESCSNLFPVVKPSEEVPEPPPVPPAFASAAFFGTPPEGIKSEPTEAGEGGSYPLGLQGKIKHPLNYATLEGLLNSPLEVSLGVQVTDGKKAADVQVATVKIDLLEFGLGEHTIARPELEWKLLPDLELPATVPALVGQGTVSVKISLVQEVEVAPEQPTAVAVSEGEEAEAEPPAQPAEPTKELRPTPLLTKTEAKDGRVVTLGVSLEGQLPETLPASATVAGQDLSFRFGLWLPAAPARQLADLGPDDADPLPRTLLLSKGKFVPSEGDGGRISFQDAGRRFYLSPAVVAAATEAFEDRTPLLVELARAMPPTPGTAAVDNAADMFHGITRVDLNNLADPGNTDSSATVKFKKSFGETKAAGRVRKSMLGPLGPLDVGSNPKAKMLVEGLELPPGPDSEPRPCAWAEAETDLVVSLSLTAPLHPPWAPPPKPSYSLQELVPKRNLEKIAEPTSATDDFRSEIRKAAKALATDYHSMFQDELASSSGVHAEEKVMASRQRKLVFELNRTGKYLEMKEKLRSLIVSIVKEKYKKSGDMGYDEMRELYNDLYVYLIDEMHRALNDLIKGPTKVIKSAEPDEGQLAALQALADEYEVNLDLPRAERYHQERLLASKRTDVWYSFGSYLARTGDISKAIVAFKEVVAIDPTNMDGLLALAACLWEDGASQDVQFLEQADSILQAAMELQPNNGAVWAMMGLIYEDLASGVLKTAEEETDEDVAAANARNAKFKAVQFCQAAQAQGISGINANFFAQLAILLLDLKLGRCAAKALAMATAVPRADKIRVDLDLCSSRAASLQGQEDLAIKHIKDTVRHGAKDDMRPHMLLGHVHFKAGRYSDASSAYQMALAMAPQSCPLEMYLRLGAAFLHQGQAEYALDVYTQACAARPCSSTWLGAGIASFRLGDLHAADLAFTEANIHDPHNPLVWGHLALAQVVGGRFSEAEIALKFAYKEELEDKDLMLEVGGAYMTHGMYREAEQVLKHSIKFAEGPELRAMLGDSLYEQNSLEEAALNYEAVVKTEDHFTVDKEDGNATHCLAQLIKCYQTLGREAETADAMAFSSELFRVEKWMETATVLR